mgnify:CR=1 FL=1
MANDIGLTEADAARAALVATEAATNLLRHAGQGEILIAPRADGDLRSVTIASLDSGPGMANTAECMEDGFTTGDGPGVGLGTIQRQSDMFELFSISGQGTVVVATIHPRPFIEAPVASQFLPQAGSAIFGCFAVPAAGETACGDGWAVRRSAGITDILVCDGLGHGSKAAEATDAACTTFAAQSGAESLEESMERIDRALHGTRGAAVALASIDDRCSASWGSATSPVGCGGTAAPVARFRTKGSSGGIPGEPGSSSIPMKGNFSPSSPPTGSGPDGTSASIAGWRAGIR